MMKSFYQMTLLISVFTFSPLTAFASVKPLALVWNGPGACKPGCAAAAARVVKRAGFQVRYVGPGFQDEDAFKIAKLWVQPGGKSTTAAKAMGAVMLSRIRDFVAEGGGYVGFCAGGFLSTSEIGTSNEIGYGIIPGSTELYLKEGSTRRMLKVKTRGGMQRMYYAGGPYFKVSESDLKAVDGQVIARYPDGSIAGLQARYGKGKVSVVGFHPEAGFFWKISHIKIDFDGSDREFAEDMVRYATQP